jgi:hypothetical protein
VPRRGYILHPLEPDKARFVMVTAFASPCSSTESGAFTPCQCLCTRKGLRMSINEVRSIYSAYHYGDLCSGDCAHGHFDLERRAEEAEGRGSGSGRERAREKRPMRGPTVQVRKVCLIWRWAVNHNRTLHRLPLPPSPSDRPFRH